MTRRISIVGTVELTVLTLLLTWQAARILPSLAHYPWNVALLVGDALPVIFVLFRRSPLLITRSPVDWTTAFFGTAAPMLLGPGGHPVASPLLCAVLMAIGLMLNIYAKLNLRLSFGLIPANRGVQSGGPYRLVRHPMYTGYTITQLGFLLLNPSVTNLALCVGALGFQIVRVIAEEKILTQDVAYREYAAGVPFRLMPGVY